MLCGILVGGAARRMAGEAKGLLPAPDTGESLTARLARLAQQLGWTVVLVGEHPDYTRALPELKVLRDQPRDVGPIGGLGALAGQREQGSFVALACDMPALDLELLRRLAETATDSEAVAARSADGKHWEPLCARYQARATRRAIQDCLREGRRSLQAVLARLQVHALPLEAHERPLLVDWDTPEDVKGEGRR